MCSINLRITGHMIMSLALTTALVLPGCSATASQSLVPSDFGERISDKNAPIASSSFVWPTDIVKRSEAVTRTEKLMNQLRQEYRNWLCPMIDRGFFPVNASGNVSEFLIPVPNAKGGDDYVFMESVGAGCSKPGAKGTRIQVADGRTLAVAVVLGPILQKRISKFATLAARSSGFSETPRKLTVQRSVDVAYRSVFFSPARQGVLSVVVDGADDEHSSYWGRLIMDPGIRSPAQCFPYTKEIPWWSDGKVILFDIPKLRYPVYNKDGTLHGGASRYAGGLPKNDPRKFVRFSDKDRVDLDGEPLPEAIRDVGVGKPPKRQ